MVVISNFPPPDHGIHLQQPATSAVMDSKVLGTGTLYITESQLSWVNSHSGEGFSLDYRHISIHAISRDRQSFPEDCLYVLLDTAVQAPGAPAAAAAEGPRPNDAGESSHQSSGDEEEEESSVTEVRFIPEDKSTLDAMYSAMCDCQVLHPDSQDSFSEDDDDEDEDEGFNDYENQEGATTNGTPANAGSDMEVDEGQFEDAPDD